MKFKIPSNILTNVYESSNVFGEKMHVSYVDNIRFCVCPFCNFIIKFSNLITAVYCYNDFLALSIHIDVTISTTDKSGK